MWLVYRSRELSRERFFLRNHEQTRMNAKIFLFFNRQGTKEKEEKKVEGVWWRVEKATFKKFVKLVKFVDEKTPVIHY